MITPTSARSSRRAEPHLGVLCRRVLSDLRIHAAACWDVTGARKPFAPGLLRVCSGFAPLNQIGGFCPGSSCGSPRGEVDRRDATPPAIPETCPPGEGSSSLQRVDSFACFSKTLNSAVSFPIDSQADIVHPLGVRRRSDYALWRQDPLTRVGQLGRHRAWYVGANFLPSRRVGLAESP